MPCCSRSRVFDCYLKCDDDDDDGSDNGDECMCVSFLFHPLVSDPCSLHPLNCNVNIDQIRPPFTIALCMPWSSRATE